MAKLRAQPSFRRPHARILAVGAALSFMTSATSVPGSLSPRSAEAAPPLTPTQVLSEASQALNQVAQKATPAVVSISTVKSVADPEGLPEGLEDLPMEALPNPWDLFGEGPSVTPGNPNPPDGPDGPDEAESSSRALTVGSGVVIDPRGYILTNHHVIEDAEKITVNFSEKDKITAEVVGDDPSTDLAVIKIDPPQGAKLSTLAFADSASVKVGDWAVAVGSPFGLKRSVTVGIVSALGRAQMGVLDTEDFIQTDAAINPGSSGGPLLNMNGEVIGLNTAIFSQSGGFIGIGFAIPARIAKEVSAELIEHGRVRRSWMGLTAQDLDDKLSSYFKSPANTGALVTKVVRGSPADKAGLAPGDVITRFNNGTVANSDQLKSLITKAERGKSLSLEFVRDGKAESESVKLREKPAKGKKPPGPRDKAGQKPNTDPGFTVRDVIPELASLLRIKGNTGALVTDVRPGTPAFDAGITPGDVILEVNRSKVQDAKQLSSLLKKAGKEEATVLYLQRGPQDSGEQLFVALDLKS